MSNSRSNFSSKLGFVLATAGSAVGLGNIWRFPYLAAKHGGGMFLLTYLILVITFGFALACAEILIGRKTGQSAINAFSTLSKKWGFVGWFAALVPVIILPYYSVIGGWIFKYLFAFISGQATATADDGYFVDFIGKVGSPLGWFLLFIGITALIVLFGVEKGIEKASKIMMPVLVVLTLVIAVYSACMPGAWEGVLYYITPDFSHFSVTTVLAAMGQLFYSMSLAMGIMITYGSYMKKDVNVSSSVHQVEIFDTGIAFLAGLMVVPAVFSFSGGSEEALSKGPSLMFITLPKVFESMPGGTVIGIIFFLMVLFAALTSSISLMETVVSVVQDKFKLNRKITCLIVFAGSAILGIPSSLGNGIWANIKIFGFAFLDFFDFISNSVLMPIVALLTCIFIGYVIKPKTLIEEAEASAQFKEKKLFSVIIKYIAPICIILILGFSVLEAFGIIKV
ncbi:MAG: sodium-dependent transporter [Acutalibacteraceae bacterium]|nr:sodium-dependent transporter [Acutalibacteraceae bacterium]